MADADSDVVPVYRRLVDDLLSRADEVKADKQIEPPLTESTLGESIWLVRGEDETLVNQLNQQTRLAAVEIAFREKFYYLLVCMDSRGRRVNWWLTSRFFKASTSIDEPAFIRIWNLLDIISIFSDNG